ncbi:hypothetical protein [Mogibacterium pumilum]|uniref:DUF4064 domain-containing protein n=1 Tax=Mogibacterium pumilum TaxID=86332 RepID=A0A223AS56_9FIRM|nr:hypothetical protein [Mogibacterium pumilum]ASS37767.1 hypothetical protein AXF17_04420 [Mogibacterium pumilum]
MTEQNIAKKGIILNTVLVIATLVAFLVIKITNQFLLSSYGYSGYYTEIYTIQRATFIGLIVVSIVIIICSVVLMTKSRSKNTGFLLLIIGAVVAAILAMLGLVLGIVTWILCGVSINQFRKLQGESNFESNLDFGAVAELKKTANNNTQAQASPASEAPVQNVETVVEAEAVPAEAEAESAPVDVAYEVKVDDVTAPSENNEA